MKDLKSKWATVAPEDRAKYRSQAEQLSEQGQQGLEEQELRDMTIKKILKQMSSQVRDYSREA